MILVDEPRWPAHGTVFGHLVSDESLAELHGFARASGLPIRAFDHDHYDIPAARFDECVSMGAQVVSPKDLVRRLIAAGLRVRPGERTPTRSAVLPSLRQEWAALMPTQPGLGERLLAAWSEPHRVYHDVRHLAHCLTSLNLLAEAEPVVVLALWFHDAVYQGRPGRDEHESARLAESCLGGVLSRAEVSEVARLILLTASHDADSRDVRGQLMCDADLAVLALPEPRYHTYVRDVRLEYSQLPAEQFRVGRTRVVAGLLGRESIYSSDSGRRLWQDAAAGNLAAEPINFG